MELQMPAAEQKGWTAAKWIYASLMGTLLLSYLYVILTYREGFMFNGGTYSLPMFIWILRLVSVGMTLVMGKLWKDKGFWILMAYLLLMVVRLLLENSIRLFALSVSESLLCGLWVYIACYGITRVLSFRQIKQFLSVCVMIWTIGITAFSCIGLYAYWTDQQILNLTGTAFFGVWPVYQRMALCYYITVSAAVVSITIGIASIAFLSYRQKWIKAIYGLAWIIMMVTLVLFATRAANIVTGIYLGTMTGIGILNRFYKKNRDVEAGRLKTLGVWLLAILAAGAVLTVVMIGLMKMIPVINAVKTRGGIISSALAENVRENDAVVTRSYIDLGLNGRVKRWNLILSYLKDHPMLLLTGASIFFPMKTAGVLDIQHAHCRMLMVLLESGIPGLLLYLLFYGYIVRCSVRIIKSDRMPKWIRLLPALAAGVVIGELVECLTWLQSGTSPMLPFLMVACGIISTYGSGKEAVIE